ncbi:6-phosphogluconolactonase [Bradyrhizobium roseum]|uniref:6-phosphogluconolactonase n=1 Tax=Bradyrhizobium roseum TaxID=3056648 RepID=UPI00387E3901
MIEVADPTALAAAAAEHVLARTAANRGRVAICLTGGSSPTRLYQLLATESYRNRLPWHRVHWFIGDERFVPANDPLHNMSMARAAFLDRCAPPENIHPIPTATTDLTDPDRAAALYQRELQSFYGADAIDNARPLFDLVLMGVGPDGHIASLFPDDPALDETARWVVGVPRANVTPLVPRVTLTLPTLASCCEMLFEVAGTDKRAILTRVFAGENLPANRARSTGETFWLVDRAAIPENFGGR